MKILVRYYNGVNLGDDLFIKMLVERYPEHTFLVPSYGLNSMPIKASNLRIIRFPFPHRWFGIMSRIIGFASPQLWIMSRKVDAMVYIGGSIFMEPKVSKAWESELRFYRALKVPYYIIGANIGPFVSDRFIPVIRQIFAGAQDVCLRDSASYEYVKELPNVRLATDIVFSLNIDKYQVVSKNKVLISAIDPYKKFNDDVANKYESFMASAAANFVRKGYEVVFMSFCAFEGDEDANKRIISKISTSLLKNISEYNYRGDLGQALKEIASSELVIASRFHASVLGLVFKKKILPVIYSSKTSDLLEDIGFKGEVIQIKDIKSVEFNQSNINDMPITSIVSQRAIAETQFIELDKLLMPGA